MPDVSIIIPCFRHGRLLAQAVTSALAQTHPAVEVIVVNDGSDDDTEEVAQSLGDRIVYIAKPNGGLSSARNAGLAAATGHFVLFLDADDLLHPEAVARLVTAAAPQGGRMAMMGVRHFTDESDLISGHAFIPAFRGPLAPEIFFHNHPIHGILCPKSPIVAAGGFDESFRAVEDWDLWIRLAIRGIEVASIPWCGGFYRQVAGSMSSDRRLMAHAKCQTLAKAWEEVRQREDFWNSWAGGFLRGLYAARRNCKTLGLTSEVPAIQTMIDELRRRGIRVCRSSPAALRLQDAAPAAVGDCLEAAGLGLARLCWPSFYDSCKN